MLATRSLDDEQMDDDALDPAVYAAVVRDLARVNTITMARRPTINFFDRVRVRSGGAPLRILDVGFGDGDMLRTIHRWGARRGVALELVGVDLNPRSAPAAIASTPASMAIEWRTGDYAGCAGEGWDVVISSLVAHHMTHDQLTGFLRFMDAQASRGWLVNDLHRHGFAWMGYPLLAMLMRWHPIVRADGRLSIARSYRPPEWHPILAEAGVRTARVFRAFPFRLCVESIR